VKKPQIYWRIKPLFWSNCNIQK